MPTLYFRKVLRGLAASGHLGDRASAVPFGCRKCFPLGARTEHQTALVLIARHLCDLETGEVVRAALSSIEESAAGVCSGH